MRDLTWDLTLMYHDHKDWEADFARIRPLAEAFGAFRGRLAENAAILRDALETLDAFERVGEKVYVYAHLRSDENTADNANRAAQNRVESLFAALSEISAWFEPELMAIPEERMASFLAAPELAFYRRSLEELLRERAHILSEPEERLLGLFSDVLSAPDKTFSILNDADLDFGKILNAAGRRVPLTHGSYRRFLESPERAVRRRAFKGMFGAYHKLRNTFAATLDGAVKRHAVEAGARHYKTSLDAALFDDCVPESVYLNLIATVRENLAPLHRYLELRRKALGLRKLDMFDLFVPLARESAETYEWGEAVALVKAACAPLGEEYCHNLEKAFSERWVDVPERKGKRSGAYSSGCYDSVPYLLLNYNGTLNDVFTLAHELGHSLHSYASNTHQAYHYADYSIFVAEVASTTNEILLSEHLLRATADRTLQIRLLCHLLDDIRSTVYRQTMFAEFELRIHRLAEAQTPLTADLLDAEYLELNTLYHGSAVQADPAIAGEWARIPHFHYNFYVYKYATGMAAAIKLSENLLGGDAKLREDYLGFLRAGGSKDVLEIMRDAGVDLASPSPIRDALKYFEHAVERLEKLILAE